MTNSEEAKQVCQALAPTPVLLNMVEHGATPSYTPQEAQDLGFGLMIFPFAAIAPAYYAIREVLQRVKDTGKTGLAKEFTPKKLFETVGLKQATAIDLAAGGQMYSRV